MVSYPFAAQVFFSVDNIVSLLYNFLKPISTVYYCFLFFKMGAILTKHIENAQLVIIEDDTPDGIDYFQILSRLDTPIITIAPEDE